MSGLQAVQGRRLPDALLVAVKYLRPLPEVTALVAARVYANALPAGVAFPCVRLVTITSNEVVPGWFVAEQIQVDCWGSTDQDWSGARILARTLRTALGTLPGVHPDGVVTDVQPVAGPAPFDDPDVDRAGARFDVEVYVHP